MLDLLLHVSIITLLYAIAAISLNLQAGVTGLLNFGQVAFFGLGAYGTGIAVQAGLHPLIGLVGGAAAAALAGAALGRLGRTLAAEYWAISTLALAELLRLIIVNERWLANGPHGISSIPRVWGDTGADSRLPMLVTASVALVVFLAVAQRLTGVQFGRVARLLREQPMLAASLGHDIVSVKVRMMAVSAAMAAVAGSLFAHYLSFIGPDNLLPIETFLFWAMIVVGGLGNHVGVVLGAVIVNTVFVGSRFLADAVDLPAEQAASLRVLAIGAALLGFLLFRTEGLIPERPRRISA